jgi:hypothetical protein
VSLINRSGAGLRGWTDEEDQVCSVEPLAVQRWLFTGNTLPQGAWLVSPSASRVMPYRASTCPPAVGYSDATLCLWRWREGHSTDGWKERVVWMRWGSRAKQSSGGAARLWMRRSGDECWRGGSGRVFSSAPGGSNFFRNLLTLAAGRVVLQNWLFLQYVRFLWAVHRSKSDDLKIEGT